VEVLGFDGFEVCFARQEPSDPSVGVFDPAFLPRGVRIAEVCFEAEWMEQEVSGELGSVVEGERLSKVFGDSEEQASQMLGDEFSGLIVGPCGEEDARASLVQGQDELAIFCEADEIGFPVTDGGSIESFGCSRMDGNAVFYEACGASSAHASNAALAFAARKLVRPWEPCRWKRTSSST